MAKIFADPVEQHPWGNRSVEGAARVHPGKPSGLMCSVGVKLSEGYFRKHVFSNVGGSPEDAIRAIHGLQSHRPIRPETLSPISHRATGSAGR